MKLNEVIALFKLFGFTEEYVRTALAAGDTASEAFERLKTVLQLRWFEVCQESSVAKQKELRPSYDRLMAISMKSRTTESSIHEEAQARVNTMFQEMAKDAQHRKTQNLQEAFDFASEYSKRIAEAKARKAVKKVRKRKGRVVIDVGD